ncbi:MAG: 30S ribosomal protein S4 [Candidatus Omnitrophica bacterium]|nr:30S ribosomal protein S4 [Candidatus Omnitrophota bacterium]
MARYIGPSCRLCRRERMKLFLKGVRCYGPKCSIQRRDQIPGQHTQQRKKMSDYGLQIREKQKVKRIYGILEKQFKFYFKKASKSKGVTGQTLLQMLERRLDNAVYRIGFAPSRSSARQMVHHKDIRVNGKRMDVPSYQLKLGDTIEIKAKDEKVNRIKEAIEKTKERSVPDWLQLNAKELKGVVTRLPNKEDIEIPVQEQLIVELYSK